MKQVIVLVAMIVVGLVLFGAVSGMGSVMTNDENTGSIDLAEGVITDLNDYL